MEKIFKGIYLGTSLVNGRLQYHEKVNIKKSAIKTESRQRHARYCSAIAQPLLSHSLEWTLHDRGKVNFIKQIMFKLCKEKVCTYLCFRMK